jgi:hypothetical protein
VKRLYAAICVTALVVAAAIVSPGLAAAKRPVSVPPSLSPGGPLVSVTPPPGSLRSFTAAATYLSHNWSGYAAFTDPVSKSASGTVSDVKGTWIVPTVTQGPFDAFCSDWIGIDGFSDHSVEQLGTACDWYQGTAYYYAWWEMFPAGETEIETMTVRPGDTMSAEVRWVSGNTFQLTITDTSASDSTTQTFQTTQPLAGAATAQRSSAEWIHEAPSASLGLLPLALTSSVTFTDCAATIGPANTPGTSGPIGGAGWYNAAINLVSTTVPSVDLALPSSLLNGSAAFTVQRSATKYPGTVGISAAPTSVKLPKPFVLQGRLFPGMSNDPCVVYVKKPGSARWSYSSNRLAYWPSYSDVGYADWWYRYTPKATGTYQFYVQYAGDSGRLAATSKTISVSVK